MDGERKKRKKDIAEAEAEEDNNEEENMELFFALIRSTRDVRERMMMSNADRLKLEEEEEEQKKKANENKQPVAVWNPTFQPEDFVEDHPQIATTPLSTSTTQEAGPSNSRKEDDEVKDEDDKRGVDHHDLELKLSL